MTVLQRKELNQSDGLMLLDRLARSVKFTLDQAELELGKEDVAAALATLNNDRMRALRILVSAQ